MTNKQTNKTMKMMTIKYFTLFTLRIAMLLLYITLLIGFLITLLIIILFLYTFWDDTLYTVCMEELERLFSNKHYCTQVMYKNACYEGNNYKLEDWSILFMDNPSDRDMDFPDAHLENLEIDTRSQAEREYWDNAAETAQDKPYPLNIPEASDRETIPSDLLSRDKDDPDSHLTLLRNEIRIANNDAKNYITKYYETDDYHYYKLSRSAEDQMEATQKELRNHLNEKYNGDFPNSDVPSQDNNSDQNNNS